MDASTDWVIVGRFGRTHGIRGSIVIHSFTEPYDGLLQYKEYLYVHIRQQWHKIDIKQFDVRSKILVAQIVGYDTVEQVSVLTNAELAIPKDKLPMLPTGQYYWHDLVGMTVDNISGVELGCVTEMMSTGANDVLVVEGKKRHLVPYLLGEFVISINQQDRKIVVDWDPDF